MRKTLATGAIVAMVAMAAPGTQIAQAHPTRHYRGGCTFLTLNDTLPTEPLGGQNQWTGEASAAIVATTPDTDPSPEINNSTPTPTDPISFVCTLWRNGTTNLGTILSGSGTGAVADTEAPFTFTAGPTDTMSVCEYVVVNGEVHGSTTVWSAEACGESTRTPVIPDPVTELLGGPLDQVSCWALRAIAPALNAIDTTVLFVDHVSGDLSLLGDVFWDCPDYGAFGPTEYVGKSPFIFTDLDGDGDEELAVVNPAATHGTVNTQLFELSGRNCPLPMTGICETLHIVCDLQFPPGPARDECHAILDSIFSTTTDIGTGGATLAALFVRHATGSEYNIYVRGTLGGVPAVDWDDDGDADVIWE